MTVRRLLIALLVLATLAPAAARAQTPPPAPPPEPPRIAEGVTVGPVQVGGMTEQEARAAVQAAFDRKVQFRFKRVWEVRPAKFGARAYVGRAVAEALLAVPGEQVGLDIWYDRALVRKYVAYLDRVFSRAPRDSVLLLRRLRPHITKARVGVDVVRPAMRAAIGRALARTGRGPIRLRIAYLRPRVTRSDFGSIIVIRRESRRLYLYRRASFVRSFSIAVGMPAYPTPLGRYRVISKEKNPTWDPPNSPWAKGLGPVPPGPGNPLGTRWIGTSAPAIGIHGTPQPWTVGTRASHGCIRMYMSQVEWLYERVRVGTPVFIVRA